MNPDIIFLYTNEYFTRLFNKKSVHKVLLLQLLLHRFINLVLLFCHTSSAVNIILFEANIVFETGGQRQETDKNRSPQTQATQTVTYLQSAEMLQASGIF